MLIKRLLVTFFSILVLLSFSSNTFACACCAEPGTYSISTFKPDTYYLGVLGEMEFGNKGELYMTEAGFDGIKGLAGIQKEFESESWIAGGGEFDLVGSFTAKTWKFNLKTPSGKSGILTLPIPSQMLTFKVDIHDGAPNTETTLYKEFRFKGAVQGGTGIFKSSILKPTTYFLVFQGRGNGCDNATDFTHWHLEINGSKADYEFYGKMKTD
jgi:hypothetical protein